MQQYSGALSESDIGQEVLKINFVTKAWPDTEKLEEVED